MENAGKHSMTVNRFLGFNVKPDKARQAPDITAPAERMMPLDKCIPKRIFYAQHTGESEENIMTATEKKISALFEELVPGSGKADTVAGEIIRAISRIAYRNLNDGDHIGIGYGKETCNPAARYLIKKAGEEVADAIADLWGVEPDDLYDKGLADVEEKILCYIEAHPELKTTPNSEDMWDYLDKDEDVDDYEDDEEDEW